MTPLFWFTPDGGARGRISPSEVVERRTLALFFLARVQMRAVWWARGDLNPHVLADTGT